MTHTYANSDEAMKAIADYDARVRAAAPNLLEALAVSYTHLTLPTIYSV